MVGYIKSPMNYTGGKYKLLPYILPSFPGELSRFVDLFAGGLNVGINVQADVIYANDQITYLIELYRMFQRMELEELLTAIQARIAQFDLSQTNEAGYRALRAEYNQSRSLLDLLMLSFYSFNHQIRFNSRHEFNMPFGRNRSSYNPSIERNLVRFCSALHQKNVILSAGDFRSFDVSALSAQDLVYCDPPYRITTGAYNDGKRGFQDWTAAEDRDLLELLDYLNGRGVRFALSNVLVHKGQSNDMLIAWSKQYHVTYLDKTYSNCSYHLKDRDAKTVEVLITNYEWEEPRCQPIASAK